MASADIEQAASEAAKVVMDAEALLIGAGAGMGVDSGLPDFRGKEGFWNAYPPFRKLGLSFVQLANPAWFQNDPELAWGFYGHRMMLYRRTQPHAGFDVLLRWAERMPAGYFVFTSNIDGHFQKAGFDPLRVVECHGSLEHLQCTGAYNSKNRECWDGIWEADCEVTVDPETFRAKPPLPVCRFCGRLARPNVLMFGDYGFIDDRTEEQGRRYLRWLESVRGRRLAIVELGAGTAVPSVRNECERRLGKLVRINLREPEVPEGDIAIPAGSLAALQLIDQMIQSR